MISSDSAARCPSPAQVAEAGVWIARLHGEQRGQELEAGFRRWLAEQPGNRHAFEVATEVWEDARDLRRIIPLVPVEDRARGARLPWAAAALAAAIGILAIGIVWYVRSGVVATDVGEQRLVTLEDGTRVFLNTATRVVVHYDEALRRVELESGEALFNVARRSDWPFIVTAGDRQVRALGTSFVVRRDDQQLAVTLVEGKVTVSQAFGGGSPNVRAAAEPAAASVPALASSQTSSKAPAVVSQSRAYTLIPGERLTFPANDIVRLDRPSLEQAVAWRHGQVVLDDTPLADAVAEMNRYNTRRLVVERPEAAGLRVNGLFQAGDSSSFANAVAQTYGLQVTERSEEIVLGGVPEPAAGRSR